MEQSYSAAVYDAITYMHAHLHEPLDLTGLAAQAAYSPYHFSRLFKKSVGVPPLYYLSGLRLQRAKELLIETTFPVRDIGMEIGQQSVGTFTTSFAARVGVTPGAFRASMASAENSFSSLKTTRHWAEPALPTVETSIQGRIYSEIPFEGFVLIGLFPRPMPEGVPLYGTLCDTADEYHIPCVKPGLYYVMATSIAWKMKVNDILIPHHTFRTRSREALHVEAGRPLEKKDIYLYPPRFDDPPILVSLSLLMNNFLRRQAETAIGKK
ncbi:helix-turn-helix domain-containing protein [Marinococcus halophilus]|uniref:helix-turn-helix domain-containing protein n=1 Tax=Marinococcus halophilus TaxID=1371 RepID=UPI0009A74B1A|nr:AraC family transcriptional regulator [Marinococcus halophilus]